MANTRKSTPKYEVYHIISGQVVLGGVSKTEAARFAAHMDEGRTGKTRFATRRQDRPIFENGFSGQVDGARSGIIEALGGMRA